MNLIVFIFLFIPIVYQAIYGFRAKEYKAVNKQGLQSAGMEIIGTLIAFFIFHQAENDFKMTVLYTGFTFLLSIGMLVMIQNLLLFLKKNQ